VDRLGHRPLVTYVMVATLARTGDAGAVVGVVMAAVANPDNPAYAAGLLAAGLSAPHLLAPLLARRLDAARDARSALSAASGCYALLTAAVAVTVGGLPWWAVAPLVVGAGAAGPLLTGGTSSILAALVPKDERAQARAQGWDAVTYGVAGTGGPALVGLLATLWSPAASLSALAALVAASAALVWLLPAGRSSGPSSPLPLRAAAAVVARSGPLRRVGLLTVVASLVTSAVIVVAVLLRPQGVSGALLVTVFGLANLLAALVVALLPSRGEPERRVLLWVVVLAVSLATTAMATTGALVVAAFALAGASTAPYTTATLATRSRYSPAEARAMVFVCLAGVKTASGSLGSAAAGLLAGLGITAGFLLAAGLLVLAVASAAIDRRRCGGTLGS
jgi:MFS family permease